MTTASVRSVAFVVAVFIGSAHVAVAGGLAEPVLEPQLEPCLSYGNLSPVTVGIFGGTSGGDSYGGLTGTLATSTAGGRSLQFDAEIGRSGEQTYGSLAAHVALFERDNLLTGLYASATKYQDSDTIWRLGAEVYADLDRVSLAAVAGLQNAGSTKGFAQADLGLALGDSSRMILGVGYDAGGTAKLRFEHDFAGATSAGPTTLYVEGTTREKGGDSVVLGINMTLGGKPGTYCPPAGKAAAVAKFRSWSRPNQQLQAASVVAVTRACTLADVPNFTPDPGCTYDVGGTVVNGDASSCAIAGSVCS
jgi:hypothetical protein